jgi:hypothetical protein
VEADIRAELGRLKCNNKDPDETTWDDLTDTRNCTNGPRSKKTKEELSNRTWTNKDRTGGRRERGLPHTGNRLHKMV